MRGMLGLVGMARPCRRSRLPLEPACIPACAARRDLRCCRRIHGCDRERRHGAHRHLSRERISRPSIRRQCGVRLQPGRAGRNTITGTSSQWRRVGTSPIARSIEICPLAGRCAAAPAPPCQDRLRRTHQTEPVVCDQAIVTLQIHDTRRRGAGCCRLRPDEKYLRSLPPYEVYLSKGIKFGDD